MKSSDQLKTQAAIRAHGARRAMAHLKAPLQAGTLGLPPSAVTSKPPGRAPAGVPSGIPQDLPDLRKGRPMARKRGGGFPFVAPGGAGDMGSLTGGPISMVGGGKSVAKLTAKARKAIPTKSFALPGRRYPINDASHARNALARVSQFGSSEEKARVRGVVARKYPKIGKKAAASGFEGIVDRPTQFLVGEAGPERVRVQPIDQRTAAIETRLMRAVQRFQKAR